MASVQNLAREWLRLDRDEHTRKEIQDLLETGNVAELESRLVQRISFGTAGLRSSMKAGFAHMNSLTVIQASQGLAAYLLKQDSDAKTKGVVIGHDARYNSRHFAQLAAAAFAAKGIKVYTFNDYVHTPLVPFAVKHLSACAGVMVTASHNPAQDNGYKVYWSNACQIIPPHDAGIATAIKENLEPVTWDTTVNTEDVQGRVTDAYFEALSALLSVERHSDLPAVDFIYTPMHGVGLPFMERANKLSSMGFKMHYVMEQCEPDPSFPTVKFPNPEERGALDCAIAAADAHGVELILANDPDADRFSAAERLQDGSWHQFTGNQLGILLASHVLSTSKDPTVLASTVSSRMLSVMASTSNFQFRETLTGFKWLGNVALQLHAQGHNPVFAFEEAIGYMFPSVVWDKDGIAAAAVFLTACAAWKANGLTPWTRLRQLYEQYGFFEDANTYLVSPSPAVTNAIFAAIRDPQPANLGKRGITRWRDLTVGYDSGTADHKPELPVDAKTQMITCELEDGVRFTVRGSGTEPKIKLYIEASAESSEAAKKSAEEVQEDLFREWFKVGSGNGLRPAGS